MRQAGNVPGTPIPWPLAAGAALLVCLAAIGIANLSSDGGEKIVSAEGDRVFGRGESVPPTKLAVEDDRSSPVTQQTTSRSSNRSPDRIDPRSARTFHGEVKDPSGLPVSGVVVMSRSGAVVATTDARGAFTYNPGADTSSVLMLSKPDYRATSVQLAAPQAGETPEVWRQEITMTPLGPLYPVDGYVELPKRFVSGAAYARLESATNRARYTAPVEDNGFYQFPAVEAGDDYRLRVGATRYFKSVERGPLTILGTTRLPDVRLEALRFADLTVHVLDTAGLPVANRDMVVDIESERSSSKYVSTDSTGMINLQQVPEGVLTLQTRGYPKLEVSDIRFDAWQDTSLVVTMNVGNRALNGKVVDEAGRPVRGAVVEVSTSTGEQEMTSRATFRTHTNVAGEFRFSSLASGKHELRVSSPRFEPLTVEAAPGDAPMTLVLHGLSQ